MELEIHWPERDISSDNDESDEDDAVNRWLDDPFRRKILYATYFLYQSIEITLIATLTAVVTVAIYQFNFVSQAALDSAIWVAVAASIAIVGLDGVIARFYKSMISAAAFHIVYVVLLVSAHIYALVNNGSVHKYSLSRVASSKVMEDIPIQKLLKVGKKRRKRKLRL